MCIIFQTRFLELLKTRPLITWISEKAKQSSLAKQLDNFSFQGCQSRFVQNGNQIRQLAV
jgi:hypothetical protein